MRVRRQQNRKGPSPHWIAERGARHFFLVRAFGGEAKNRSRMFVLFEAISFFKKLILAFQCWRVQERIWLSFEGSEDRSKIENSLLTLMSGYADLTVLQKQVQHISTDLSIFEVHCGIFRC